LATDTAIGQFARYLLVGCITTSVGLGCIYLAMWFGANDVAANALGYGVGIPMSYALNSVWTFGRREVRVNSFWRFIVVLAVAYPVNLITMLAARDLAGVDSHIAQMLGILAYTLTGFFGSRVFVFQGK
jgi:putative flippase GtrA